MALMKLVLGIVTWKDFVWVNLIVGFLELRWLSHLEDNIINSISFSFFMK